MRIILKTLMAVEPRSETIKTGIHSYLSENPGILALSWREE